VREWSRSVIGDVEHIKPAEPKKAKVGAAKSSGAVKKGPGPIK
jgi:hypothetical protein